MNRCTPVAVTLIALSLAPRSGAAQQAAALHEPLAYVSAALAVQALADERFLALRARVDLSLPGHARPWLSVGTWGITGMGCFDSPCGISGTELGVGVDAAAGPSAARLQPFAGAGLETWQLDTGAFRLAPVAHAGSDLRLSGSLALRLGLELSSYPVQGATILLGGGVRVTVPLVKTEECMASSRTPSSGHCRPRYSSPSPAAPTTRGGHRGKAKVTAARFDHGGRSVGGSGPRWRFHNRSSRGEVCVSPFFCSWWPRRRPARIRSRCRPMASDRPRAPWRPRGRRSTPGEAYPFRCRSRPEARPCEGQGPTARLGRPERYLTSPDTSFGGIPRSFRPAT